MQLQFVTLPFPLSGEKIECRQFHLIALQQLLHIGPEQSRINGIDMFQVQFTIRPRHNLIPVNIIIIQTDQNRLFPLDPKLRCKPIGRCGLAGRTGACQHNRFGTSTADSVRHLGIPLLMQSLIDPDQFPESARCGQLIQIRHGLTFH